MSDERIKVPPGPPGEQEAPAAASGDEIMMNMIRANKPKAISNKANRPELERLAIERGIAAEGRTKAELIVMLKAWCQQNSPAVEVDEEYQGKGFEIPEWEDEPGKTQIVLRCVKCNNIHIKFQPGFDPRHPVVNGERLPFWRWPFKFLGRSRHTKDELQNRSREQPTCPFCHYRILVRRGYELVPRTIVKLED